MKIDTRARFTLRMPRELLGILSANSARAGVPINALILQILWDWTGRNASGGTDPASGGDFPS